MSWWWAVQGCHGYPLDPWLRLAIPSPGTYPLSTPPPPPPPPASIQTPYIHTNLQELRLPHEHQDLLAHPKRSRMKKQARIKYTIFCLLQHTFWQMVWAIFLRVHNNYYTFLLLLLLLLLTLALWHLRTTMYSTIYPMYVPWNTYSLSCKVCEFVGIILGGQALLLRHA